MDLSFVHNLFIHAFVVTKKMKNPNGYGSVVKLPGNRRRPFVVRKTKGWNEKGQPVYSVIAYTETREEGNILLAQFNAEPWNVDKSSITFAELFNLWKEKCLHKLSASNSKSLRSAYNHCKNIQGMRYKDIKAYHMQKCVDECGRGASIQNSIKNLFHHLDQFASLDLDIISKCYSMYVKTEPAPETVKDRFSNEEIDRIWAHKNEKWVDSVIVLIYTGFRITEFLNLKTADVDLEQKIIRGGIKTRAGKNRIVPIHPLVYDFIKVRYDEGNEYLFSYNKKNAIKTDITKSGMK